MKKLIILFVFLTVLMSFKFVSAADELLFDSTEKYIGACQLTDKSEWTLPNDLNVTNFQIWYKWNDGETTLPITVYQNGKEFASFTAARTTCDTYQKNWCNADYALNKVMPKGTYSTKITEARQCLEPGKTGTVRLYGTTNTTNVNSSNNITRTSGTNDKNTISRTGFSRTWPYYAVGVLLIGGIIFYFVRKK